MKYTIQIVENNQPKGWKYFAKVYEGETSEIKNYRATGGGDTIEAAKAEAIYKIKPEKVLSEETIEI